MATMISSCHGQYSQHPALSLTLLAVEQDYVQELNKKKFGFPVVVFFGRNQFDVHEAT